MATFFFKDTLRGIPVWLNTVRAPRLRGPRNWKMLLNKRKKEEVGREKKGKKEKGGKEGEKEKGKVKEIVFRTNKLTERFPCWSMERF